MTITTDLKRYEYPPGSGKYRLLNDEDAKRLGVAGKGTTEGLQTVEEALASDGTPTEPTVLSSATVGTATEPTEPTPPTEPTEPTGDPGTADTEAEQKKRSARR